MTGEVCRHYMLTASDRIIGCSGKINRQSRADLMGSEINLRAPLQSMLPLVAAAFVLNVAWEMVQARFFADMAGLSFWDASRRCLLATVGDVAITVVAYCAVAAWVRQMNLDAERRDAPRRLILDNRIGHVDRDRATRRGRRKMALRFGDAPCALPWDWVGSRRPMASPALAVACARAAIRFVRSTWALTFAMASPDRYQSMRDAPMDVHCPLQCRRSARTNNMVSGKGSAISRELASIEESREAPMILQAFERQFDESPCGMAVHESLN